MMNNAQLATASLDDIVFDGRNRHYGAYQLRALYQRHMTRALIIATAALALLLVFPLLARLLKDEPPVAPADLGKDKRVVLPPPLFPERVITPPPAAPAKSVAPAAPATPTAPRVATTRFVEMKPVPDDQVTEEIPDQDALAKTAISNVTATGEATAADLAPLTKGNSTGNDIIGSGVVKETIFISVEQMPQLVTGGGTAAIVAAIQKLAKYPALALRNGVEGRVYVSFVVNSQGDVTDVKVVKGLGSGLDEETIRAVQSLPKFIPGKQNGQAVSVAFTVPISFHIQ